MSFHLQFRLGCLRSVLLGSAGITVLVSFGCGSRLVDSGTSRPLQPVATRPAAVPTPSRRPDLVSLPRVPASGVLSPTNEHPAARYYEVKQGDTLSGIAAAYRTSVDRLVEANGFENKTTLQPGQLLYIPKTR